MRLSIITTMADHPWGGSEELWVDLANEALNNNDNVSASVYNWKKTPEKIKESQDNGLRLYKRERISYPTFRGKIKGKIIQKTWAKFQLHSFIRKSNPDFLIVSMGAFCDLEIDPFRKFLKLINIPFALIVHVNTERYTINSAKIDEIRSVVKKAKSIFFVSQRLRQQAERQLAYNFENSDIIVNPVNMDEIGTLPIPDLKIIQFACVGRLQVDVKGQALLIQVLSTEKWRNRVWHLNIYGTGPDKQLIQNLITFYKLNDRITIHGFVNDIRNEIWKVNHILLMPSYFEGLPIALIEAMLSGRTAVVTDVGGNGEIIKDKKTGFIAEAASPMSFDKALEIAWSKKTEWLEFGVLAHNDAVQYFGNNPSLDLLNKIIDLIDE